MVLMDENACLWFLQHRNDINKQFKEPKWRKMKNYSPWNNEARGLERKCKMNSVLCMKNEVEKALKRVFGHEIFLKILSKHGDELRSVKTRKLKFENEFKKNQILGKHEEKISQGENSPCQIFATHFLSCEMGF